MNCVQAVYHWYVFVIDYPSPFIQRCRMLFYFPFITFSLWSLFIISLFDSSNLFGFNVYLSNTFWCFCCALCFSILFVTITTMMMSFTACFADFLLTRHALYWQVGLMPVTCAIGNIPSRHWSLHPLKLIVCFFCQRSIFILASRALPVVRVKRYFKEKEMILKFLLL